MSGEQQSPGMCSLFTIRYSLFAFPRRLASRVPIASTAAMGLVILVLGLLIFIGTHVFVALREQRAAMIALMAAIFVFGVYPQPIFDALRSTRSVTAIGSR